MTPQGAPISGAVASSQGNGAAQSRWRIWFQAIRFSSFTASAIPILVGSALALVDRSFSLPLFLLMLAAAIACHAGANLANDYFDHIKGIDTEASLGPSKVIQQGLLSPAEVKRGMVVAFAIATILGLVIVAQSGWPVLVIALLSLAAAVLYTGGPIPLGYVALGEVIVFLFMGPVMVGGAYFVMTGSLSWPALLLSLPVGLLVAAILHANNMRDIDLDREAGKMTLATNLGRSAANWEYALLVWGAFAAVAVLIALAPELWPTVLVAVTVPVAYRLTRLAFSDADGATLNPLLRKTAGLHLRFGGLLTLSLLIRTTLDRVG